MDEDLRHARHDLRGRLNALQLCVSALPILNNPEEELEFLTMIEQAAERTILALDDLEAAYSQAGMLDEAGE